MQLGFLFLLRKYVQLCDLAKICHLDIPFVLLEWKSQSYVKFSPKTAIFNQSKIYFVLCLLWIFQYFYLTALGFNSHGLQRPPSFAYFSVFSLSWTKKWNAYKKSKKSYNNTNLECFGKWRVLKYFSMSRGSPIDQKSFAMGI